MKRAIIPSDNQQQGPDARKGITLLYHAEGYVTSWIDHEADALVTKTYNLNFGEHAKKLFDANMEAFEVFKPKHIIIDRSLATGLQDPREEEVWLRNTLFPECQKLGIKKVINILPKNPISRYGTRNWLDIGKEFGFDFIELSSIEEAYSYLGIKKD